MTKFLALFQLVVSLLPSIISIIKTIEASYQESGQGAVKLAFLREVLESLFEANKDGTVTFDEAWPVLQKVSGATVNFFNSVGIFKKAE